MSDFLFRLIKGNISTLGGAGRKEIGKQKVSSTPTYYRSDRNLETKKRNSMNEKKIYTFFLSEYSNFHMISIGKMSLTGEFV